MRLDQWLWAVRIFKSRSLSAEAIKGGRVKVNGAATKPGELVVARIDMLTRTVRVIGAPPSRVGAKLVPLYAEELTPPEEFAKRRDPNFRPISIRPKGAGRPTKRERRRLDEFES